MPEVIVIDEIGRQQEAAAARTIAERGVQLVGTAHGITLDNLLINPTLSDLVGGIESVTLSDEEARRRGTQKAVLERRSPPTFDVLIEIQDRQRMAVHHNVAAAVDAMLRGRPAAPEIRYRDESGHVRIQAPPPTTEARSRSSAFPGRGAEPGSRVAGQPGAASEGRFPFEKRHPTPQAAGHPGEPAPEAEAAERAEPAVSRAKSGRTVRLYAYGVSRGRLVQAAQNLGVPATVVESLEEADAAITLKNYYRKHPQPITEAEQRRIPVYVLRSNTVNQVEACLGDIFGVQVEVEDPVERAMTETQEAIRRVLGGSNSEDLRPATAEIRRMQHEMARTANLISHSYGNEPRRRVRIFPS